MKYTTVRNCHWANEAQTIINCEVDFDDLQEEFVPFSAVATDPYPHVQEIFNRAVAKLVCDHAHEEGAPTADK